MESIRAHWQELFMSGKGEPDWWKRKMELWEREKGSIVKVEAKGEPYRTLRFDNHTRNEYLLHLRFLIKQEDHYHIEEQLCRYKVETENGEIIKHEEMLPAYVEYANPPIQPVMSDEGERREFVYDRREAVRYAERWWNSYNPAFRVFDDDCTNYISQCLHAGGAPMRGAPLRDEGWWYQRDNWSFSWAVAHSMRWYLSGSTTGLRGRELEDPKDLMPGDVICYDFQGDGRWDHTTIVVNKDANGMPLVNAHTNNSRNRYWTYEDSAAWTPNIQYKFFRIGE